MAKYLYALTYDSGGSEGPEIYTLLAERNGLTQAELWWEFCRDNFSTPDEQCFESVRRHRVIDLCAYDLERLIAQNAEPRDPNPPRYVQEAIAAEKTGRTRGGGR